MTPSRCDTAATPNPVPFRDALRFWFVLGFISFGGPAGQIALMHRALVDERRWISERRFLHALNFCMVLPGPEAQQLATYLGWLMHGRLGGIIAGLLFILPSFAILVLLSFIYVSFGAVPLVDAIFEGLKPAVVAVVLQACHRLATRTLQGPLLWSIAGLALCATLLGVSFPLILLGAALCGVAGARFAPTAFRLPGSVTAPGTQRVMARPAYIDDDTPTPPHARHRPGHLIRVLLVGLGLWGAGIMLLAALFGREHLLTIMALFFTKAALLTFGGAYAVLPYVHDGAVNTYGWLSSGQMLDGLALGESTPGPLIMIVAFVGYVAGHAAAFLGQGEAHLAGVSAALVATAFTFLPSFLLVLAGGPMVEATRDRHAYLAVFTAISAAVVSAMLNLALVLAQHVILPSGLVSSPDPVALAVTVGAALALIVGRRKVPEVFIAAALLAAAGYGLKIF